MRMRLLLCATIATCMSLEGCACIQMESRLSSAMTASEEAEAFRSIANCPTLYSIVFYDRDGKHLTEDRGPGFSKVGFIEIQWATGSRIRHQVIDPENLPLLLVQ